MWISEYELVAWSVVAILVGACTVGWLQEKVKGGMVALAIPRMIVYALFWPITLPLFAWQLLKQVRSKRANSQDSRSA